MTTFNDSIWKNNRNVFAHLCRSTWQIATWSMHILHQISLNKQNCLTDKYISYAAKAHNFTANFVTVISDLVLICVTNVKWYRFSSLHNFNLLSFFTWQLDLFRWFMYRKNSCHNKEQTKTITNGFPTEFYLKLFSTQK